MNISSLIIIGILFLGSVLLILKISIMRKSIREIEQSLKYILKSDTNNIISITSEDKEIKLLATSINEEIIKLRNQKLQYENGNQKLKRLLTDISHDLRTPLTAIRGYAELLEEENLNVKQNEYLKIIGNKTEELTSLTEQLRDLSIGIDSERKIKKEICCVNALLEETIASCYNLFKEKNIVPEINICKKQICKNIDKDMIIRVFENLISNAIKYTDDSCKIILNDDGKISFSNKASRLDVITVKKIFERYYTLENMKKYSGLGLAIAKELVEINGGIITARYKKNELCIEILL